MGITSVFLSNIWFIKGGVRIKKSPFLCSCYISTERGIKPDT